MHVDGTDSAIAATRMGNWKVNDAGVTVFQHTAALKSFKDLHSRSQIKEVAEHQMQLQQKLL